MPRKKPVADQSNCRLLSASKIDPEFLQYINTLSVIINHYLATVVPKNAGEQEYYAYRQTNEFKELDRLSRSISGYFYQPEIAYEIMAVSKPERYAYFWRTLRCWKTSESTINLLENLYEKNKTETVDFVRTLREQRNKINIMVKEIPKKIAYN